MSDNKQKHTSLFKRVLFFLKFLEIRLRFVLILVITALVVGYWDHIQNYYERWQRERTAGEHAGHTEEEMQSDTEYYCGMHPFVVRDRPGKCPICGMDLTPRKKGAPVTLPEGTLARVQASPDRVMQAGARAEPVLYRLLSRTVRSYGIVEADETRLKEVVARFPGRVENLAVNTTGEVVKEGQALASIYSPEFLAGSDEYRRALTAHQRLNANPGVSAEEKQRAARLVEGARRKLSLAGFTKEQLSVVAEGNAPKTEVTLYSPVAGTVMEKNVLEGQTVMEGTVLYRIADLTTLWVQVQVIESDLSAVRLGMPVEVTSVSWPGEIFYGTVDFISPELNPENRSVKVRVVVQNHDGKLKPGMYANAVIRAPLGQYGTPGTLRLTKAESAPEAPAPNSSDGKALPVLPTTTQAAADRYVASLAEGDRYHTCTMHPEVVSDKAGDCPKCGMTLVEKTKQAVSKGDEAAVSLPTATPEDADKFLASLPEGGKYYVCPMDPQVVTDNPEHRCPLCKMKLDEAVKGVEGESKGAEAPATPAPASGLPTITPEKAEAFLAALPASGEYYTCTMDPQVVSDKPGECPLCGMDLIKTTKPADAEGPAGGSYERVAEGYACGMHPDELSDKPGKCTICGCGMEMVKWEVERVLSVPESAVIDTGTKKVVYVETEPGLYDARAVELGPRSGNYYPVLAGLTLGQKIVTQGSFLIDAEARLNPAAAGVSATDGSAAGSEGGGTGHQHGG